MKDYDGFTKPQDWLCGVCGKTRGSHDIHAFERQKLDFVGMLRIKNEQAHIAEVIESLLPLCKRIFIFDDHSVDDTRRICRNYKEVTLYHSRFSGMNEARDKNWLLDQINAECEAEWIVCVDGDEVLEEEGPDKIREHLATHDTCQAFSLQIVFLWNDPNTVRVDRIYGDFWRPSIFKPFQPKPDTPDHLKLYKELRFMSTPFGRKQKDDQPNLHCSSVPQRLLHGHQRCPVKLLHYGYMERGQRVRKLDFYSSIDWANKAEDFYRHMTAGDDVRLAELPHVQRLLAERKLTNRDVEYMLNVPASMSTLHAGPVKLESLEEIAHTAILSDS
jgi:glycosyltransferase involved in cell wall biosynthesis